MEHFNAGDGRLLGLAETNDFDGFYTRYRDSSMVRKNTNGTDFRGFDDELVHGGYVGGPIIQDRLHFFFGYEDFQRGSPKPDGGPVGSGASTIVPGVTEAFINSVRQAAQNRHESSGHRSPSAARGDKLRYGRRVPAKAKAVARFRHSPW